MVSFTKQGNGLGNDKLIQYVKYGILYKADPDRDLDFQKKTDPEPLEIADPIPEFTV